jgi:hypothetical protein
MGAGAEPEPGPGWLVNLDPALKLLLRALPADPPPRLLLLLLQLLLQLLLLLSLLQLLLLLLLLGGHPPALPLPPNEGVRFTQPFVLSLPPHAL